MADYFIIDPADGFPHIDKDPDATIPYQWDFTDWMTAVGAASITAAIDIIDTGVTLSGVVGVSAGLVTQKVAGGTAGSSYRVRCRVTADNGAIDDRTIVLDIIER